MFKTIKESLNSRLNYLIIGDVMIDKYILGEVKRISPEAPVPVLKVKNKKHNPGGAGNVAVNISGLNSDVTIVGFTGRDESLDLLSLDLEGYKNIELRPTIWSRNTITKTRLISGQQQIVRIDEEESFSPTSLELDNLLSDINNIDLSNFNGIVLSDYAKGVCSDSVCQNVIKRAANLNIPTIVDPKGSNWEKYKGATVLTPNLKEVGDVYGMEIPNNDSEVERVGLELLNRFNLTNIIITRSEKGMTLINRNTTEHFPTMAKDVFDVSGAGDTVVAGVIRFLTAGLDIKDAINIANFAAGIVVGHVGTWPIKMEELLEKSSDSKTLNSTIIDLKKNHKKIVFTNGCFDLLHPGHVDYMQKAKELGDYLIIGLNSDESVRRLKGKDRPVNSEQVRKTMLEALGCVDAVEIFNEDTPYQLIKRISPDILVKGGDYNIEDIVGREFAKETKTIEFLEGFSTTSLIDRIKQAYV
ncbi:D-glycero-beta-D-manno-heptose 1-phosphate adenylyltransferase [Thiospirochaeta perfilievii]|uniref:Bifunctional protein HldE n=1 Tax=Thiospirochaeta perfilievii TaxID=252967 RepID=A0A5C1QGJ4_9SPIO|nr:D-glycero-beta-D-manno-heptose 1-phosphate adenylyltransferase [Thiospirochaeta perfilievii]QEN05686.1 D-glycero-beta-D-manno-heptose 1-phosphate adenylyltransferase [Thiospirochaeta perfilievii]